MRFTGEFYLGLPVMDERPDEMDDSDIMLELQDYIEHDPAAPYRPKEPGVLQLEFEDWDPVEGGTWNAYWVTKREVPNPENPTELITKTDYNIKEFNDPEKLERWIEQQVPQDVENREEMIRNGVALMCNFRLANLIYAEGRSEKILIKRRQRLGAPAQKVRDTTPSIDR